jgi:hypothetical protein
LTGSLLTRSRAVRLGEGGRPFIFPKKLNGRPIYCAKSRLPCVGVACDAFPHAGQKRVSAVAEFERELIRERVRGGMVNARRKGSVIGRPPVSVKQPRLRRQWAELEARVPGWRA